MDFEKLCRILKTGKPTTKISLPDDLKKLSEAELLEFLNKNEKKIIDGVIDTFSKCGIKITANDNKLTIESPGYYTVTYNVKTMKMTKTHPTGFGSSKPRFTGGTKFTRRNITKKNRKSLKHLKKNIHGMVRNGGAEFVDPASFLLNSVIELICYALIGVAAVGAAGIAIGAAGIAIGAAGIAIGLYPVVWACKTIYERFNGNPTTVIPTNTNRDPYNRKYEAFTDNSEIDENSKNKAIEIYKAVSNYIYSNTDDDSENNLQTLQTAIDSAIDRNILDIVIIVMDKGLPRTYLTSLMFACKKGKMFDANKHISIEANEDKMNKAVNALINAGADVNKVSNKGKTALHIASGESNQFIVYALINAGADVNKVSNSDITALHIACMEGNQYVVDALITAGADVNKVSTNGTTALYLASGYQFPDIVKALINAGADLNTARTDTGDTPLHVAIRIRINNYNADPGSISFLNSLKIVEILLKAGADVNAKNTAEQTPKDLAQNNNKILDLLETYGHRNTTLLLMDPREGVLQDLEVAHHLDASTTRDLYKYLGPNQNSSLINNGDSTPGGKNSRSKTRKQKRRKTKK